MWRITRRLLLVIERTLSKIWPFSKVRNTSVPLARAGQGCSAKIGRWCVCLEGGYWRSAVLGAVLASLHTTLGSALRSSPEKFINQTKTLPLFVKKYLENLSHTLTWIEFPGLVLRPTRNSQLYTQKSRNIHSYYTSCFAGMSLDLQHGNWYVNYFERMVTASLVWLL